MNPNTEFTYTPNDPDFTGTDQFTYTVCDNGTHKRVIQQQFTLP
jgi:hypothetical protein